MLSLPNLCLAIFVALISADEIGYHINPRIIGAVGIAFVVFLLLALSGVLTFAIPLKKRK